ncbi:MAG: glycosyltransferase family 2 protein [Armatimonadota bacterium]
MPGVSVIVPLYNKAPYIQRAIDSILHQTFADFEVLVVDDGSDDGSAEVVRACPDARVRLILQEHGGVSVARNRGIAESRGRLVAFLDADDAWLPSFLAIVTALHQRFPQAGALGTAYRVELQPGTFHTPEFARAPAEEHGGLLEDYFAAPYLCSSAVAVRRDVLEDVGGFPPGIRYGEDLDLWVRIALRYPVAWSPEVAAIYHNSNPAHNSWGKFYVGDAPFAAHCTLEGHRHAYELLCSQRLRTFALGTYLAGHRTLARRLVGECRHTKGERKRYWLMQCLTALPVPMGRLVYRLVQRDWRPFQFVTVEIPG